MIIHLFNSSSVSGPEQLVLPALAENPDRFMVLNLVEERIDGLWDSDPLEAFARSLGLRYARVPVRQRWDRLAIRELRRLIDTLAPDLVHAHAIKASIYLARAMKGSGIPLVSTHHGVHGAPDAKVRAYEWFYRKMFLPAFDRVLCVSSPDYNDVLHSGIESERLRLHPNGVDRRLVGLAERPAESAAIRAAWLGPAHPFADDFFFGVAARLSPEKNHARMIRVLDELHRLSTEREWRCLVFGTGSLEVDLRRQAASSGLGQRILWMGYRRQLGNELAGLDLLLSFSKSEGLPINLIEAGWAGTPVMCTPVGGVTDILPDETYGLRISPGESDRQTARRLRTLLSIPGSDRLAALASRFQERVRSRWNRQSWMRRLFEIYAELGVPGAYPS